MAALENGGDSAGRSESIVSCDDPFLRKSVAGVGMILRLGGDDSCLLTDRSCETVSHA
jgi:hypothetical protein